MQRESVLHRQRTGTQLTFASRLCPLQIAPVQLQALQRCKAQFLNGAALTAVTQLIAAPLARRACATPAPPSRGVTPSSGVLQLR